MERHRESLPAPRSPTMLPPSPLARALLPTPIVMNESTKQSPAPHRGWRVRSRSGLVRQVHSLSHMALLILDGQVDARDEISAGGGAWTPLETVLDTSELAKSLVALGHLGRGDLAA